MECMSPTHVPIIVKSGPGQDWTNQHMVSHHLSLGHHTKQPGQAQIPMPFIRDLTANMKTWSAARQQSPRRPTLHIPTQGPARVEKPTLRSAMKDTKSSKEWETLLNKSLGDLQGIYATMEAPTPAQSSSQTLGQRVLPKSDASGLNRAEMLSKALQAAVGGAPPMSDSYDGESSGSEDSYQSEEAPATPETVEADGDAAIDPRLFE